MENDQAAAELANLPGLRLYDPSVVQHEGIWYALADAGNGRVRQLALYASGDTPGLEDFEGISQEAGESLLLLCPLNARNAAALRQHLPWLRPGVQGLRTGAGLGDRLGLATRGHLRAVRAVRGDLVPFPAQQSIREMSRTGRPPQQVMDDAMWGVFAEGWRAGFGADADHVKTPEDIDRCLAAGYTFYTFDPGEYVESAADSATPQTPRDRLDELPWEQLEDSPAALAARYLSKPIQCEKYGISFDETTLTRAAVKYGRAIAHVARMYRHLERAGASKSWEVEISVDETETPTTHAEHVYIATELRRLGVRWVSLAPRYIGQFEKGVDYIGDVGAFEADIAVHAAIARAGALQAEPALWLGQVSHLRGCCPPDARRRSSQDGGHKLSGGPAHACRARTRSLALHLCFRARTLRDRSRQLSRLRPAGTRPRTRYARGRGPASAPGAI